MNQIVSAAWLQEHLSDPDLIVLDASPAATVDGSVSELAGQTIPGAIKVDLKDNFSASDAPFPNTIPSPEQFEQSCRELGIDQDSILVVFDNLGVYTSPRVWWLFQAMGHENIAVLDGGLPAWVDEGNHTVGYHEEPTEKGNFKATPRDGYLKTYQDMVSNAEACDFTVVDARSKGRFDGTAPEPRKGLKSGHMPHSVNIPYQDVLTDGRFKSPQVLRQLFDEVSPTGNLVFSCGSGLTACIIMLAREIAFGDSRMVYDGSWTEWAELQGLKEDAD